jgi:hypothetical protein
MDDCNVCLFINESGCVEELGAGTFVIAETPIRPLWIDDGCDWEAALDTPAAEPFDVAGALTEIAELHVEFVTDDDFYCMACGREWPCATRRAIDTAAWPDCKTTPGEKCVCRAGNPGGCLRERERSRLGPFDVKAEAMAQFKAAAELVRGEGA